ncbi:alpha/beta fold hydrolase [Reichenbachiella ulvae]|uniref:Alpha/beta hydrolase n=1 Tax=Reichenbachiella ulvae TaxID=2980104 RepID=A0ABT3CZ29_9BACT|nr:alpha/beta hydrolase [Reichenbachiella ulvae]MCV9388882.1 alpha/beta hydrolase [Reichenbachiella ulvae]
MNKTLNTMRKLICNQNPLTPWIAILIGLLTAISVSSNGQSANSLSFEVEVTGQGPDLIFIPGLTCDGAVWDETAAKLSNSYTCHVITLPGFAGKEAIDVSEGFCPKMSTEIITYAQGLDHPSIIGHSLGGFLALDMLSKEPALFDRAIIVDGLPFLAAVTNPYATEESMKEASKAIIAAQAQMSEEQFVQQQRSTLQTMITAEEDIETAMQWGLASDRATVNQAMYELYTTDLRDEMSQVKTPVLVLGAYIAYKQYGVTKEMTMKNFESQFALLEEVKIELSDKGKHFIMWDDPEFFMQQTEAFLSDIF